MEQAILIVRVVFGLLIAAHGAQKLFGWFGGYGLQGVGQYLEALGFRPGRPFAAAAGVAEFAGGLLVAAGVLGPLGGALIVSVMIVAAATVHWGHGLFATNNGIELPLLYATVGAALTLSDAGRYSLDALLGLSRFWTPELNVIVLIGGIVGGFANLALRRKPEVARASA